MASDFSFLCSRLYKPSKDALRHKVGILGNALQSHPLYFKCVNLLQRIRDDKKLQLSARMKIREGKLEGFKRQAAVCISKAKEKDPGTLQYDWFLNSDKTECEIREAYESSEALLAHTANLRELLGILFEQYATDHSVVLYGDPSPELMQTAKMRGVEVKIYSFFQGLE